MQTHCILAALQFLLFNLIHCNIQICSQPGPWSSLHEEKDSKYTRPPILAWIPGLHPWPLCAHTSLPTGTTLYSHMLIMVIVLCISIHYFTIRKKQEWDMIFCWWHCPRPPSNLWYFSIGSYLSEVYTPLVHKTS